MSLELIRESVKLNQVVGEESTQTVFENDIIVPDVKPDIISVLMADGDIFVDSAEVRNDKILIGGIINYKILYLSDESEQQIKSINTNTDFSYALDVPNASQGMRCAVNCDIEHIDYDILNGRKVKVRTIVKVEGKVMDEVEKGIVNDLDGIADIQILRDSQNINCYLGSSESEYTVRETFEVPAGKPAIKEILRNDVKITGKDFKLTDNKVIAKGDLNIYTLYIADDETRSIQIMEHEVPFTQFVDLEGVTEETMCSVDFRIKGSHFDMAEDSDGEFRNLNGEVSVNINAEAYEKKNIQLISDAYSPNARLALEKESFNLKEYVTENKSQAVLKDTIAISGDSPEIGEVFNVLCKPALVEASVNSDKIVIEGIVNNNVFYVANSQEKPVFCYKQEMPFKHSIDIKGISPQMETKVVLDVEHCNYSMLSATEVEIRLAINVTVKVSKEVSVPVIVKVNELPFDEKKNKNQPSLTIYFSQPGDNLWKIAKKYYTTVDSIQKLNGFNERDIVNPGQKVLIPKRMA